MFGLFFLVIPLVYIFIKTILYVLVIKYGKFSYDGFSAAGFAYNSKKDIFYSVKNAWQKNFGYTHAYDVYAPLFQMIIDTVPIRFYYNNKNWLISFWKGQYGIVTGAEIGIYSTNQMKVNKKTLYMPVSEDEMLNMEIALYKKGKLITEVKSKHWWLAIFKLGMFSKPKDLTMDIKLIFPDKEMLMAFLSSFKKLGYKPKDYSVENNAFYFRFKKSRVRQVWTRMWLADEIRQSINRRNVDLYNKYFNDLVDNNKIDDYEYNTENLIMVNDFIPKIFKNPAFNDSSEEKMNNEEKNVVLLASNIYSEFK